MPFFELPPPPLFYSGATRSDVVIYHKLSHHSFAIPFICDHCGWSFCATLIGPRKRFQLAPMGLKVVAGWDGVSGEPGPDWAFPRHLLGVRSTRCSLGFEFSLSLPGRQDQRQQPGSELNRFISSLSVMDKAEFGIVSKLPPVPDSRYFVNF